MIGPPGSGKNVLAQRLPGLLPPLRLSEEVASLESAAGRRPTLGLSPPFHSPQHTASVAALIGGGALRPGELSLAHLGVLFLDELPEFARNALEALREPLESGVVLLSRAKCTYEFPANFQLVAAMNPCPCGYSRVASIASHRHCAAGLIRAGVPSGIKAGAHLRGPRRRAAHAHAGCGRSGQTPRVGASYLMKRIDGGTIETSCKAR